MKKILIMPLIILLIFSLTACSQRPFQGPAGTTLVQRDTLEYYYSNEVGSNKIFTYTFTEELVFFEGPFAQNYTFQQVDPYELISDNFIDFLDSFDYVYYDKEETEEDYDNIELSTGASENNHNLVDVPVDDKVYFVDAYILDPSGLRIIFSYTEFYSEGKRIVVPYHIAFLVYELLIPNDLGATVNGEDSPNGEELLRIDYTSYLLPIPPEMRFSRDTYPSEVVTEEVYTKYFTDDGDYFNCGLGYTEHCFQAMSIQPNIYAQNITAIELTDMFINLFNGRTIGTEFVITVNGVDLTVHYIEENQEILVKYYLFSS